MITIAFVCKHCRIIIYLISKQKNSLCPTPILTLQFSKYLRALTV